MKPSLRILLEKEWRELRRDRRVLIVSLILPVLLYPGLMGASQRLQSRHAGQMQERELRVAIADSTGPYAGVVEHDSTLVPVVVAADSLEAAVRERRADVAFARKVAGAGGTVSLDSIRVWAASAREDSREASRRLLEDFEELRAEMLREDLDRAGVPSQSLDVVVLRAHSIATAAEEGGAEAAKIAIYLLLMILYMAGSVLATDMVAGEKERGTLETLFLAPVDRSEIAKAKVIVVAVGTAATGLLCLAGLVASYHWGWVRADDGSAIRLGLLPFGGLALLAVPAGALIGSVLLGISTWARSLKEAQTSMLPVMLVLLVPALMSMQQSIEMSTFIAVIPVANLAFLMRDLLAGHLSVVYLLLSLVATTIYLALVLRKVTAMLGREELVLGFDHEALLARTPSGQRRALHLSLASSLLIYFYLGQWLQSRWEVGGLAVSLWGLLPLFVFGGLMLTHSVRDWREVLGIRLPRPGAGLGAILLAWGAILPLVVGWQWVQDRFMPAPNLPSAFAESLGELGLPLAVFLLAFSPAVVEELLFRGLALGVLRRSGLPAGAAIFGSAFYFALMHMSVHRFVLTFLLGSLLGFAAYRGRSILVSMLLHFTYNASLVLGLDYFSRHEMPIDPRGFLGWTLSGGGLVAGFLLLRREAPLRGAARDVS